MSYADIINIVVAGGSGSRFGGPLPKQFLPLDGIPVLMRAIGRIEAALPDSHTVVVLGDGFTGLWHDLVRATRIPVTRDSHRRLYPLGIGKERHRRHFRPAGLDHNRARRRTAARDP